MDCTYNKIRGLQYTNEYWEKSTTTCNKEKFRYFRNEKREKTRKGNEKLGKRKQ